MTSPHDLPTRSGQRVEDLGDRVWSYSLDGWFAYYEPGVGTHLQSPEGADVHELHLKEIIADAVEDYQRRQSDPRAIEEQRGDERMEASRG